ncbi:CD276 antigen [Danio aesculapii]|uniref:CD276 antigen n=1 Tax=Danio aesculapii TaxID=1142201 RepID=UPI0024C0BCCE|nr:CD276 antigen [Danio aesculapii]
MPQIVTDIIGCHALWLFSIFCSLLLIRQVCSQASVVGFTGGTAVLPCSSEQPQRTVQDIIVRWRHNGLDVFEIIDGTVSAKAQDPAYRNRAQSFPEQYKNGNFSIKLRDLQDSDSGKYTCYIIQDSIIRDVKLNIEARVSRRIDNQGTKPSPEIPVMIFSILCVGLAFSLANSATGFSIQHLVSVPSPDK